MTAFLADENISPQSAAHLRHQTVEAVNKVLTRFLQTGVLDDEEMQKALIVVSENTYRVYRGSRGEF